MKGTGVHHWLCSAALAAWVAAQGLGGWAACGELCGTLSEHSRECMEWLADVEERLDKEKRHKHMECTTLDGHKVVIHWYEE